MRKGYGQFCPVAKGAEVFAERWTPLVVRELLEGSTRFNDLHRGVPLMSRSMLSIRLKQLEDVGVVTRFGDNELDVSLLMWDIHRKVHPEYFPPGRTTVQFVFAGVPAGRRHWWLISATSEVDVCPIDPGFEIDLHVTTHLRTLTKIWLGDLTYRIALTKGDIKLDGPRPLQRHFEQWLGRSARADVKDARRNVRAAVMNSDQVVQSTPGSRS
jgi:hypothetical protein